MKRNNIQEKTWLGKFGDDYCKRNIVTEKEVKDCEKIFNDIFKKVNTKKINRVLEVGCNQGRNLLAMQNVFECECFGIEPNKLAIESIKKKDGIISNNIVEAFADDIPFKNSFFDLVFTSVVLIHIPNNKLDKCIDEIYRVSRNYILTIEYFFLIMRKSSTEEKKDYCLNEIMAQPSLTNILNSSSLTTVFLETCDSSRQC